MQDLTVDQVEAIHSRIVKEGNEDTRIISEANLYQMIFNANLIHEAIPRTALVFYSLCAFPVFRAGNYRTALAMTEQLLASEGYLITGNRADLRSLAEGICEYIAEPEEIEQWLRNNTRKNPGRE
jgi:prophage maintenance system killer protein